jgi:hypothetical protein
VKLALLVPLLLAGCGREPLARAERYPAIVYFTLGPSCPYCTRIESDLRELAAGKIDVRIEPAVTDASKAAMMRYGIRQGHGLVLLDERGEVRTRIEGHDIPRPRIEELFE